MGTTKKHSALRKIAVDNDESHPASAGAVVGDVAKSTARGMEEVVQGASKAASSIFSKFLGLFGHANQITLQGNQEEPTQEEPTQVKLEEPTQEEPTQEEPTSAPKAEE